MNHDVGQYIEAGSMSRRRRRLVLALLCLALTALFLRLGWWQLDRAAQKRQRLETIDLRQQQAALGYAEALLLVPTERQWRRLRLRGEYLQDRYFLLDNRIRDGRVGYEVLQPLRLASGRLVLVNRGWVAARRTRAELPPVAQPTGQVELQGLVVDAAEAPPPGESGTSWPRVVQRAHLATLQAQLGEPLEPILLRLQAGNAGALGTDWPEARLGPQRHQAYAWQWFTFAGLLPLLLLLAWRHRDRLPPAGPAR